LPDATDPSQARQEAIGKLRELIAHPGTSEDIRKLARERLDSLAPRDTRVLPGSPLRRASDPVIEARVVARELIEAAYGQGAAADGEAAAQLRHVLDVMT
jgi:hypothetical protein